jgi:hypothetical protein
MRTSSKGDVSINSGTVTGLSYGTLYYIYYDDPTLAGGSPTYHATTTKETAINGTGRFFVGSIITAVSGGPQTVGSNDGGVGSQAGATLVSLGGSSTSSGVSNAATTGVPSNFFDGKTTTFFGVKNGGVSGVAGASYTFQGMPATSAPWTSLTLYVRSAVPSNPNFAGCSVSLAYSTDLFQSTNNSIYNLTGGATRALTTDSFALPINQNLALLAVQAQITRTSGAGTSAIEIDLYEFYVVGVQ